ncbi:hypothetical protein BKA66DRAFT_568572 [Pyrenochaeta sp. MPI-SDFR-AT-0127]|nr:hypothetical protein BKA66DRAFT_568572 [Pyrenochaeta sp. MPI-SDFR-AT-0127]
MFAHCSLWAYFFLLFGATALLTQDTPKAGTFMCTGGTIYFVAHPVDSLLFQNPDLFHDLYVLKCVTTVVFTAGDRNMIGNFTLSLERGLEEAHAWMAGLSPPVPARKEATIQIGNYRVPLYSLNTMPNIQMLYLRLPDGAPTGRGYDTNGGESLKKLYNMEIKRITAIDGTATYRLKDLMDLIATVLHKRQPNDVRVLNYKGLSSDDNADSSDHADHVVSAKIVMDVIERERLNVKVQAYAGNFMRKLEANLIPSHPDMEKKTGAFFKYAEYDEHMCQSIEECEERLKEGNNEVFLDEDVKYAAQYLEREYYVS